MATEKLFNDPGTTLSAGIDNSVTTVPVTSAAVYGSTGNFRIRIDSEVMLVTAISSNNLTVTRGIEGTTAASHLGFLGMGSALTRVTLFDWTVS